MNKDECEELFDKVLFEKRKKGDIFFGLKLGMEICRQGLGSWKHISTFNGSPLIVALPPIASTGVT